MFSHPWTGPDGRVAPLTLFVIRVYPILPVHAKYSLICENGVRNQANNLHALRYNRDQQ